jgi:hypothetical protein
MKRVRSGVRSTKVQVQQHPEITEAEAALAEIRKKHKDVFMTIRDATEEVHTDQTGRFPVVSRKGHKYIMVLIEIDSNYIAMEPMRSRETAEMIKTYKIIMDRLAKQGIKPKKQLLDNEASQEYKEAIEEYEMEWELVPPHNHRRLLAERAIQTAKAHLIANILGCDPTFPMREWHRLMPQIEMTLNML